MGQMFLIQLLLCLRPAILFTQYSQIHIPTSFLEKAHLLVLIIQTMKEIQIKSNKEHQNLAMWSWLLQHKAVFLEALDSSVMSDTLLDAYFLPPPMLVSPNIYFKSSFFQNKCTWSVS